MKAFECKQCGACCHGKGGIFVEGDEIPRIAAFLGISPEEFLSTRCYFRNGRHYIECGEDGFCIFYDRERQCTIHPVKPGPCRLWPFYAALLEDPDNWNMAKDGCPGINPDSSFEEFRRQWRG